MVRIWKDSAELRAELREDDYPTIVAFSRGKDAIGAFLALKESGHDLRAFHYDLVPGLSFVDESIDYFNRTLGIEILRLPHPSFYRWVQHHMWRPPHQLDAVEATDVFHADWTYEHAQTAARQKFGDGWVATGVRAADSIQRLRAMRRHGPVNHKLLAYWAIFDWKVADLESAIRRHGVKLPIDYHWWNRTFDGLGYPYLSVMRRERPDDFAKCVEWFPFIELEMFRYDKVAPPVRK